MRKSFLILIFLVLVCPFSSHLAGQANMKTQPLTNVNDHKTPISSARSAPISTEPNAEAKVLFEQGLKQTEAGQHSQAAESFSKAVILDPEHADAYAALGRAYFKMRQWQKAIDNLNRAGALRAKQREANDALKQQVSIKKPEEPGARVSAIPSSRPETKLQQATNANAAVVNPRPADSPTLQQPDQGAGGVIPLKGDNGNVLEQKQEAEGVRVSMNMSPSLSPIETKSVTSITTEASGAEVSATTIYRVGPNDVLDIHLNDSHAPQSTLFTVTPSGLLEHPMLTEPLLVAGFTANEIATKIENELKKLELIQDPKVIVGVRDYASHAILVSGLVKDPGTRFLRREAIPLYVVVADAQPLPEAARVTVVRNELKRIYEMDLGQAQDMNFLVRPGDVVTLNPNVTQFIYIGGEVKSSGEKTFRRGLTLMQAIIAAGGATAKSKAAEVGRDDGRGFLVMTRFDLQGIRSGKATDPLLRPGDRIMIVR